MTRRGHRTIKWQSWIQVQGCLTSTMTLFIVAVRPWDQQEAAGSKNPRPVPKAKGAEGGHGTHVTGLLHWDSGHTRSRQPPRTRPRRPWAPVKQAGCLMGSPLAPKHPVVPSRSHRTCSAA